MMTNKSAYWLVLAGLAFVTAPALAQTPEPAVVPANPDKYDCLYLEQVDHIDSKVDRYLDFYVKNGSGGPSLISPKDCTQKACHAMLYCTDKINGGNFVANGYCHAIKDDKGQDQCPSATRCANDSGINSSARVNLAAPRTTNNALPADSSKKPGGKTGDTK